MALRKGEKVALPLREGVGMALRDLLVSNEAEYLHMGNVLPWWHIRSGDLDAKIQAPNESEALRTAILRDKPDTISDLTSIRRLDARGRATKDTGPIYYVTTAQLLMRVVAIAEGKEGG